MLKRPRDAFDTPDSSSPPLPPSKRRYVSASLPGSSPSTSGLSTPYTLPYYRSPYSESIPHDSPSNPFGLNRTLRALTLPRPSGFGSHIVLRMQTVADPSSPFGLLRLPPADAPYRIVQVPLNYSFRHLHMLLLFLFASDAHLRVRRRKRVANHTLRGRTEPAASRKPTVPTRPSIEFPPEGDGHFFEVLENVRLYSTYRPGVVKPGTGQLVTKLSSARERKLFPDDPKPTGKDGDVFGRPLGELPAGTGGAGDENDPGWDWEAEDDFTLSNVYTNGPSLKKAIVYHHTPSASIHITVSNTRFATRKGVGNAPFVLAAHGSTRGAVRIANVARYPPIPSPPASTSKRKSKKGTQLATPSGSSDSHHSADWDSSSGTDADAPRPPVDDGVEVPDLGPHEDADEPALERWNAHGAFERFLRREAGRERAMRRPPQPADGEGKASSSSSAAADVFPPVRAVHTGRAARAVDGELPGSSPLAPRSGYRYGHRQYPRAGLDEDEEDAEALLPPSSPSTLPIEIPSDGEALWTDTDGEGSERSARENMRYMIELPLLTPFPAHPSLQRRVRRASEHMARWVTKGLKMMDVDEEQAEASTGGAADGTKGKVAEGGKKSTSVDKQKEKATEKAKAGGKSAKEARTKEKEDAAALAAAAAILVPAPAKLPARRGRKFDYDSELDRGSPVKAELKRKARAAIPPPPPRVPPPPPAPAPQVAVKSNSGSGSQESEDGGGSEESVESIEVDGFLMGAPPWLRMKGPKSDGSGWGSEEEV